MPAVPQSERLGVATISVQCCAVVASIYDKLFLYLIPQAKVDPLLYPLKLGSITMVLMVFLPRISIWRIWIYIYIYRQRYRDRKTGEAGYHLSWLSLSMHRSIECKRGEKIKFELEILYI